MWKPGVTADVLGPRGQDNVFPSHQLLELAGCDACINESIQQPEAKRDDGHEAKES